MREPAARKIPADEAIELYQQGHSYHDLARRYGVSAPTVRRKILPQLLKSEELKKYQQHRADILDLVATEILYSIDRATIEKASLQQRVTAFGILYDKMRLERGESTANVAVSESLVIVQERAKRARFKGKTGDGPDGGGDQGRQGLPILDVVPGEPEPA